MKTGAGHERSYHFRFTGTRVSVLLVALLLGLSAHADEALLAGKRFRDMGDGTVTDRETGLVWLRQVDALGTNAWAEATATCGRLAAETVEGLSDGSTAGDWRLPNIRELQSLIAYQFYNPTLSDDTGTGHWTTGAGSSFINANIFNSLTSWCWSSSSHPINTSQAWVVNFYDAQVSYGPKVGLYYVWPVRN